MTITYPMLLLANPSSACLMWPLVKAFCCLCFVVSEITMCNLMMDKCMKDNPRNSVLYECQCLALPVCYDGSSRRVSIQGACMI